MRETTRRVMASAGLGSILPLAFLGGIVMQAESHMPQADRAAFCILLPLLLFAMMAFAIWTLARQQPVSSMRH